mgnify:CR=1 FL=1
MELETIPEGSEIQLTLASPQRRINIEMNEKKNEDFLSEDDQPNLHAMSKMELLNVQRSAKEDKKQFRRWLKEKEAKLTRLDQPQHIPKSKIAPDTLISVHSHF